MTSYPLLDGVCLADGPLGCRDAVGDTTVAFAETPQLTANFLAGEKGNYGWGGKRGFVKDRNVTGLYGMLSYQEKYSPYRRRKKTPDLELTAALKSRSGSFEQGCIPERQEEHLCPDC